MTTRKLLSVLFPNGEPLVYEITLNGTPFATQWTSCVTAGDGIYLFELYLSLDPGRIGQGGSVQRQVVRMQCDDRLRVVHYTSESRGARLALRLLDTEIEVTLPDRSVQTIPRQGAEFPLEAYLVGQQALALGVAHLGRRLESEAVLQTLMVNQLVISPYTVRPAPELEAPPSKRWLRSSHQEEILIGDDGLVERIVNPAVKVEACRLSPPPPLPEWKDSAGAGFTPPRYAPPEGATFTLADVRIEGPVTLGATLTVPHEDGPHPAVLFISGGGTHDRHGFALEMDMGYHEIVDALTAAGFVGLRFDSRGAGRTGLGEDFRRIGLETAIADARAALGWLRDRPEVDPNRVFLVGHSQGGIVAADIARDSDAGVRGVALLATPGLPMDEILRAQTDAHLRNLGLPEAAVHQELDRLEQLIELVRSGRPVDGPNVADDIAVGVRNAGLLAEHLQRPPARLVEALSCPLLICQGQKDFQVPPEGADRLAEAAERAELEVAVERFPNLDHLFKAIEGQSTLATYYDRTRRVDPALIDVLRAWLAEHA